MSPIPLPVKQKGGNVSNGMTMSSDLNTKISSTHYRHLVLTDWSDDNESYYELSSDDEMTSEERTLLTCTHREQTTVSKAYFNLTVCILASALLSIPFAFDKTGWIGGLPLLAGIALLVDYTLVCLGETCMKLNVYDYQEICELSFGKVGRYLQALIQLSLSLTLMISYQIISADNLIGILRNEWVKNAINSNIPLYAVLVFVLTTTIILPLASLATLQMLGYSSMISMISIMILSVVLIYFDISRADSSSLEPLGGQLLTGLGVFATGFVCHQIITPTLEALPGDSIPTKKRNYHTVVHLAIGTSFVIFSLVGITGCYLCHDETGKTECPGNILTWKDRRGDSFSANAFGKTALAMFLITALVAYPIEHFSCYYTIHRLLYADYDQPMASTSLLIKCSLVLVTTIPALYIRNIGPLLAWAGTLAAFPLGFLLPLSLAIRNRKVGPPSSIAQIALRIGLIGVSAVLMLLQTIENFNSVFGII